MAFVWFGWSQEDPPRRWRVWLGAGSGLGLALAVPFGILTATNWSSPTALEGVLVPRLRGVESPSSRLAGPTMGATLLMSAAISAALIAL